METIIINSFYFYGDYGKMFTAQNLQGYFELQPLLPVHPKLANRVRGHSEVGNVQ